MIVVYAEVNEESYFMGIVKDGQSPQEVVEQLEKEYPEYDGKICIAIDGCGYKI